jgi:hypothetical protein
MYWYEELKLEFRVFLESYLYNLQTKVYDVLVLQPSMHFSHNNGSTGCYTAYFYQKCMCQSCIQDYNSTVKSGIDMSSPLARSVKMSPALSIAKGSKCVRASSLPRTCRWQSIYTVFCTKLCTTNKVSVSSLRVSRSHLYPSNSSYGMISNAGPPVHRSRTTH